MARAATAPERTQVRAQAKWVRMSARKARIVLDHLRGRTVPEGRTVLAVPPRAQKRLEREVARFDPRHPTPYERFAALT